MGKPESHPSRDVWIEILIMPIRQALSTQSHPSRDVWIEISIYYGKSSKNLVTSLAGCVD